MDTLIQDALEFLKETAKTVPSVFATEEEFDYFTKTLLSTQKRLSPAIQREPIKLGAAPPPPTLIPHKSHPEPLLSESPPQPTQTTSPSRLQPPPGRNHLGDIRQLVQKTFPDWALRDTIPDDALARRMSRLWEETYLCAQVVVIAFGEVGPGMEFLKQVTSAIDKLLMPAQLIEGSTLEKERGWDLLLSSPSLKTVVCSPWASWRTTSLAKYYLQNGATGEQFLGRYRLILLEPSLMYLKHPERKRELWKILSTHLSSSI